MPAGRPPKYKTPEEMQTVKLTCEEIQEHKECSEEGYVKLMRSKGLKTTLLTNKLLGYIAVVYKPENNEWFITQDLTDGTSN